MMKQKLFHYAYLMRLDKPIGILLLLWPTLWGLWLATAGHPDSKILFIFISGVILMRSAGCILNDYADRKFDSHVKRTRLRPLASRQLKSCEALLVAGVICLLAFILVWQCNLFTIQLACVGIILAIVYPFLKRITYLPQLGLGIAFSWGIPMAWAATTNSISLAAWVVFVAAILWPIIYDTLYAMMDREDDMKIGIKSTAILFKKNDRIIIAFFQLVFLLMMVIVGNIFQLKLFYYLNLFVVALLFMYQQWLIRDRNVQKCLRAFLNNNWVGVLIFVGIFMSYL